MDAIADTAKFAIGLAFLAVGAALLFAARGSRGFGQMRQAAALFLVAGIAFLAIGLGLIGGVT